MLEKIKSVLNPLINTDYDINVEDVITSLVKLCTDKILDLQDELTLIEHKDFGDIEINHEDIFYKINIKTQNVGKTYSFPNLISIKRAKDILTDHNNHIIYVFIEYEYINNMTKISKIKVQRIESLDWSYLYIQNLGKGQLQIKNIPQEEFLFNNNISREQWLNTLIEKGKEYYDSLILKVVEYKSDWEKDG